MTLPKGWTSSYLADLIKIQSGYAFKSDEYGLAGHFLIRIGNVQDGYLSPEIPKFVQLTSKTAHFELHEGDIVTSLTGNVGRIALVSKEILPAALNQRVAKLSVNSGEALEKSYFLKFLTSEGFRKPLISTGHGVAQQNVSPSAIADIEIPLPPLAEQRRIVAKLDALTARLARARAELERVPILTERLRLETLRKIFRLDIGDDESAISWPMLRVDQIGAVQLGRQRSPKDHQGPNMRPYLRAANITWNGVDLSDVKEMNFSPTEFETFKLRAGDVLLNEGSGSAKEVGKPVVWGGEIAEICFQNTLLRIRPHSYSSKLLRYCLLYMALTGKFIANTQGVNIIHIGKAGLAGTVIPVPPRSVQDGLVDEIEAAFARADRLEAEAARAKKLLDRLESALLAKAFKGELVPQDPADEPAQTLLARLRAQRATPQAKRGRRVKDMA